MAPRKVAAGRRTSSAASRRRGPQHPPVHHSARRATGGQADPVARSRTRSDLSKGQVDVDTLYVKTISVDQGPTLRGSCRARWAAPPASQKTPRATSRSSVAKARSGDIGPENHPIGFRLGVIKTWDSKWFEEKNYAQWLHEDIRIQRVREEVAQPRRRLEVEIERAANKVKVNVHTARPGIVIGKRGAGIETLKKDLQKFTENEVFLNIVEVRKAETDAQLVAENIATQLERRIAFRRAMKKAIQTAMKFGAKGIRVACSGRLGGAEMARYEWYREGRVPLHTLRADIDYGFAEAKTTYGKIGVKCWICKGEVLPTVPASRAREAPDSG